MENPQPSGWRYTRSIFNRTKYTEEEAREIQSVRGGYRKYLISRLFPKLKQTPLAFTEDNSRQPSHSIHNYDLTYLSPPQQPGELFPFAEGAVRLIIHYLAKRNQRWWRAGYDNDPICLTCVTLKNEFTRLANAPCNQDTHTQLVQLRQWIVHLMGQDSGQRIFRQEPPSGQDTFARLLSNLRQLMGSLQRQVNRRLALTFSRERFAGLHQHQKTLLTVLTQYLFYVVADTEKADSFSLLTVQQAHDKQLKTQLNQCREGWLLQQLLFNARVKALLGHSQTKAYIGGTVPLFRQPSDDIPWLDDSGTANPDLVLSLVDFDKKRITASYRQQDNLMDKALTHYCQALKQKILTPEYIKQPTTLCQVLTTDSIAPFVKLHGLALIFVDYCHYTEALWVLAGFGGDQLICQQMGQLVGRLLEDAKAIIIAIEETARRLSDTLQPCYNKADDDGRYEKWRANYKKAMLLWDTLAQQSTFYKKQIDDLLRVIKEPALYNQKRQLAKTAFKTAVHAARFSNDVAEKLGLEKKTPLPLFTQGCKSMADNEEKGHRPLINPRTQSQPSNITLSPTTTSLADKDPLTPALRAVYPISNSINEGQQAAFIQAFKNALALGETYYHWFLWLFCWGSYARYKFAKEAEIIIKSCHGLTKNNALLKDVQKLQNLKNSLGDLKLKTQKYKSSLCSWFHGETQVFLNKWPDIIDRLEANVDNLLKSSMANYTFSDALLSDEENKQFVSQQQPVNPIENTAQIAEMRQETETIKMETNSIVARNKELDGIIETLNQIKTDLSKNN